MKLQVRTINMILVFALAAASLQLELIDVRICDVLFNQSISYFVITISLVVFFLAGAVVTAFETKSRDAQPRTLTPEFVWMSGTAFVLTSTLTIPVLRLLSEVTPLESLVNILLRNFLAYVLIPLPFFFSGYAIIRLFSIEKDRPHPTYMMDILGGGLGAFLPYLLIPSIGPEKELALTGGALLIIIFFLIGSPKTWLQKTLASVAFVICIISLGYSNAQAPLRSFTKKYMAHDLRPEQIEWSAWDVNARLDVVDFSNPPTQKGINFDSHEIKYVFYDGGTIGTNIYPYNGNSDELRRIYPQDPKRHFLRLATVAAHYLKRDTNYRTYLFGVGAGQEVKAALIHGAAEIFANELVPKVIEISQGQYAKYNGQIFNSPKVHIRLGDGRLQLMHTQDLFDVIQIFSNYLSSSIASGRGLFEVNYLFTVEAFQEYFSRLKPNGILQINQFGYERILSTLTQAWRLSGGNPSDLKKQIVVIHDQRSSDILTTVLFKKSAFTSSEILDLKSLFSVGTKPDFVFLESPELNGEAGNILFSSSSATRNSLNSRSEKPASSSIKLIEQSPPTDNSPFFAAFAGRIIKPLHLLPIFILTIILMFGILYLFLYEHLRRESADYFPGGLKVYFMLIGSAYMLCQAILVQISLRLLEMPFFCYTIVLSGLLFGAGLINFLVSKFSSSFRFLSSRSLLLAGFAIISFAWLYSSINPYVITIDSLSLRGLIVFIFVAFIGSLTGLAFPQGLAKLNLIPMEKSRHVPLAWIANGLGITLGSLTSVFAPFYVGFSITLTLAGLLYITSYFFLNNKMLEHE